MRRFLITSPAFTGHIQADYNEAGSLLLLSFENCAMSLQQIAGMKATMPAQVDGIEQAFKPTRCTVVETAFEVTFDMFWIRYGKKINRARALQLWDKMNKSEQVTAWASVPFYDKYLKKDSWRPKADPETYLRQRYWENDWKNL